MVVTAGAGTGKTTSLINRILSLVEDEGVPIDRILAITFTEAAAAQMKERLRTRIEEKVKDGSDSWDDTLIRLERAQISTIHALAARILRENPIQAGIDPDFRIEEEAGEFFLRDELWELWVKKNFSGGGDFDNELVMLIKELGVEGLKGMGRELSRRPDRLFSYSETSANQKEVNDLVEMGERRLKDIKDELFRKTLEANEEDKLYIRSEKVKKILSNDTLDEIIEAFNKEGLIRRGGSKTKWGSLDEFNRVKVLVDGEDGAILGIKGLIDLKKIRGDDSILKIAIKILSDYVRFEREEKQQRGLLSYFDLLYMAKLVLQEDLRIRRRYQGLFDYILVDEFQDTDPIQGDIVLFLAEAGAKAKKPEDVALSPGKLFIVGDPKQSIYRFRDADIGLFFSVGEKIADSGGTEETLKTNYRSQGHLIGFQNAFFEDYIQFEDENFTVTYNPLIPSIEDIDSANVKTHSCLIVNSDPSGKLLSGALREREANYIATRLIEMVEGGSDGKIVRDRDTKMPRAPGYGDIAILFRSLTISHIYEDALKEGNIPYYIVGGRGYFQRQEIFDVINLLTAIYDPTDMRALFGALRSPIFGIDDSKLYRLAMGKRLNYLDDEPKDSNGHIKRVFGTLKELHRGWGGMTVTDFLDEVFEKTEIMEVNAVGPGGGQQVGNLMKIRRYAFEREVERNLTLPSFIRLLNELSTDKLEKGEEGEAVVTEDVEDSVRIMTIHKAKGLEFPIVFIPDLGRQMTFKGDDGIVTDRVSGSMLSGVRIGGLSDIGYTLNLKERAKKHYFAEEKRLLYVAATRARDRLIMVGSPKVKRSHMNALMGFLEKEAPDKDYSRLHVSLIDYTKESDKKFTVKKKAIKIGDYLKGGGETNFILEARKAHEEREREYKRAMGKSSFSRVTSETDDEEDHPLRPRDHFTPTGDMEMGRVVGTLVHDILERLNFQEEDEINGMINDLVNASPVDSNTRGEVESEVKMLVQQFMASDIRKEIAASEIIGRELPIIARIGEKTVTGRIDIAFRRGDEVIVLDYKTDRISSGEAKAYAENYRGQIETYVKTLNSAMGGGVRVKGGVYFIRPDITIYF